jgi:ligand-binding sensor domain-containing protein
MTDFDRHVAQSLHHKKSMETTKCCAMLAKKECDKRFRCIYIRLLAGLLLSIIIWKAEAQQIRFDHLTIADGLSSNSVYTIFQDSNGILWLGTLDGLHRYNGYSISVFKHDHREKGSIANNRITRIYEDRNYQLWLYDEYTSIIVRYTPAKQEFKTYYLAAIAGGDLEVLDSIYENKKGELFIRSTLGWELAYNESQDNFEVIEKGHGNRAKKFKLDQWAEVLSAFDKYLTRTSSTFNVDSLLIRKIHKDFHGRYWIATTYDGLYSAEIIGGSFQFIRHLQHPDKNKRINAAEIYDVYEDHAHVVWIGTKTDGLYRYSFYKYKFENIEEVQLETGPFHIGTVRAITRDSLKNLWIGTNDRGLLKIDTSGINAKLYVPQNGNPSSIPHRFIRSLWIENNKNLWVGHYSGFSRYLYERDQFQVYIPKVKHQEDVRVYDFKKDARDVIWMAAWDAIIQFDQKSGNMSYFSVTENAGKNLLNENIRELEMDDTHLLWIAAGEKGISLYNKSTNVFNTSHYDAGIPNGLPSNNIFDVFKDSRKNLWLATADGLCKFNPTLINCETFTTHDGLPTNFIYGIMEDRKGFLWITTTKGLSRLDPANKKVRNYDVSDGLQSNEFTENAFYHHQDGVMYVGGVNGISYFHPEKIVDNPEPPRIMITNMSVFDNPLSEMRVFDEHEIRLKLDEEEGITLNSNQHSFSIEFLALHYVNPTKNKYAYMLEGYDQQWNYRDSDVRSTTYTNLEAGTYYFNVKACNSDGVWNNRALRLKIIIVPPFYSRWWFTAIVALTIIAIGAVVYRQRIENIKKHQSMKAAQLESELNFLKSQVNPHFLFNTLNNIYALCQTNSRNAAPMVRKVSEMMRYMIYDCNANTVPLQKEIEYLQNYIDLNQLKSPKKLNVSLDVEGSIDGIVIAPLLLINFLENSFKHGNIYAHPDAFIRMLIAVRGNEVFVSIKNSFNERNFKSPSTQTGIGLENVQHRLNLLYPGKHDLSIAKNYSIFEIELKLQLD